jgi:HK97 family phage major capsid protein
MALRQLILSRKLSAKRSALEQAEAKVAGLAENRKALSLREAELEDAVKEITEETEEAVKAEVEAAVAEFEAEVAQVEADQAAAGQEVVDLQQEISDLQAELDELNAKVEKSEEPEPAEEEPAEDEAREERKVNKMNVRSMFGNAQQRAALFTREDVKSFASRVRELGTSKRSVTGGELLIPEIMLPMIREQVEQNSKLLPYVNLQHVGGTARETIMGTIPEAVWTEMCANLNELTLVFNDAEVDGYKVGGYIPVCNALLEDNDVNLVSQILFALARAIALGLDKAILYGTGTKMPLGIVTRLAQTEAPTGYPTTARPWVDLHTSNIKTITAANSTGIKLFQGLLAAFGNAKKKYGAGGKFWAMNEATHMVLVSEAMNFNANGAIVTGINGTMPVIGGDIVELDFIPDNVIIAGYGELYLLAERAGIQVANSEHFMFTADKTVYKGTARYDGLPVIAEGFVAVGINAATVAANAVTFAADTANT